MEYLTKNGKSIYNEILAFLDKNKIQDVDRFLLASLANAIDQYETTSKKINDTQMEEVNKSFSQSNYYLINKSSFDTIFKIAPKFGLSPADREKIKAFAEKEEETDDAFSQLQNKK